MISSKKYVNYVLFDCQILCNNGRCAKTKSKEQMKNRKNSSICPDRDGNHPVMEGKMVSLFPNKLMRKSDRK